jgi:hypothetical protein
MCWPDAAMVFGAVLVITTAVLACIPWQWHRKIAQRSVPRVLRFLPALGIASLALSAVILFALLGGP